MTEKEIKQRAEQYAENEWGKFRNADDWISICIDGYITGAHSRDEEIKKLKKALSSTRKTIAKLTELHNKKGE